MTIYTIGHSTRSLGELLELLRVHGVKRLADVRSYPGSRRHPHFGRAALEAVLPEHAIEYRWMPGLGGRRRPQPDSSRNRGWRVQGFRAYADHMASAEFAAALGELEAWARAAPTAFMCAEAVHFRCHRQLIADALTTRHWTVLHIVSAAAPAQHRLTSFAHIDAAGHLTYPAAPQLPLEESDST
ncbi:MAG: DUF488 domain-containing protein [Candidatus Latescibacterota bacterium]|nr:MAG: DUF488 domain-containing protein [Candidatus Latescibacterota bacterium]